MNKTLTFIAAFSTLTLAFQSSVFKTKTVAQTAERANNDFFEPGKIVIDSENLYLELQSNQQWSEQKEMGFFNEDDSYKMRIENFQTLTLDEENLMKELSGDGFKFVEF